MGRMLTLRTEACLVAHVRSALQRPSCSTARAWMHVIGPAGCRVLGRLGGDVFLGDRRFLWWQILNSGKGWSAVATGNLPRVSTAKVRTAVQVSPPGEGG